MNAEEERKARLAQALRNNLRRRKAQARDEQAKDEQAVRDEDAIPADSRGDDAPST